MKDGHIHSPYCPHGSSDSFEQYIKKAIEVGVKVMTFTEHLPLSKNFNDPSPENDSAMSEEHLIAYFNELKKIKEKYKHSVKINIGVEVDYTHNLAERNRPRKSGRVEQLASHNAPPLDLRSEGAGDGFDFGQFRHGISEG